METLVETLSEGLSSPNIVSASIALKAVAVNVSLTVLELTVTTLEWLVWRVKDVAF